MTDPAPTGPAPRSRPAQVASAGGPVPMEFDGSIADVLAAMDELNPRLRRELSKGPLEEPDCGVCGALTWDGFHCKSAAAEVIVDWHRVEAADKIYAMSGALGTTRRLTAGEFESSRQTFVHNEGHALRAGLSCMADNLAFMRCLFIYQIAGWRP